MIVFEKVDCKDMTFFVNFQILHLIQYSPVSKASFNIVLCLRHLARLLNKLKNKKKTLRMGANSFADQDFVVLLHPISRQGTPRQAVSPV